MMGNICMWLNILFKNLSAAAGKKVLPQPEWKAVREDKKANIYLQTEQIYAETNCKAITESHITALSSIPIIWNLVLVWQCYKYLSCFLNSHIHVGIHFPWDYWLFHSVCLKSLHLIHWLCFLKWTLFFKSEMKASEHHIHLIKNLE